MAGSPRPGLGPVRLILLYLPFGDRGLRWKARMPWGMQYVFPRGSEQVGSECEGVQGWVGDGERASAVAPARLLPLPPRLLHFFEDLKKFKQEIKKELRSSHDNFVRGARTMNRPPPPPPHPPHPPHPLHPLGLLDHPAPPVLCRQTAYRVVEQTSQPVQRRRSGATRTTAPAYTSEFASTTLCLSPFLLTDTLPTVQLARDLL